MNKVRAVGTHVIVSMRDLDRAGSVTVDAPGNGVIRLDGHQVDAETGLILGADRYPHQGVVISTGPFCPDDMLQPGALVMVVAKLGHRWSHEGMTLQSARAGVDCSCGAVHPSGHIIALLTHEGPVAPRGRVIAERVDERVAQVISVGPDVRDVYEGAFVVHGLHAGHRWRQDGRDLVSLRHAVCCERFVDSDLSAAMAQNVVDQAPSMVIGA